MYLLCDGAIRCIPAKEGIWDLQNDDIQNNNISLFSANRDTICLCVKIHLKFFLYTNIKSYNDSIVQKFKKHRK